jgi:hypothetical protein
MRHVGLHLAAQGRAAVGDGRRGVDEVARRPPAGRRHGQHEGQCHEAEDVQLALDREFDCHGLYSVKQS